MAKIPQQQIEPTIDEILRQYTLRQIEDGKKRAARKASGQRYIGASKIAHPCDRHIYFDMIGTVPDEPHPVWGNAGTLAAEDGHRAEIMMADRLRMIPQIELHTHDPDTGKQYGFDWGFIKGNYDGIVRGLLQAPLTWHIWDHKRAKDDKFKKLVKLVREDEKSALKKWDANYYAQQVIYMDAEELTRSYLTCSRDGGTEMTSVRTNADPKYAKALRGKAERITKLKEAPPPISTNDTVEPCLFCQFKGTCRK